jgi:hypothetical protein
MKITNAKGVSGYLIKTFGDYMFRVYAEDKTFKDYYIHHPDMGFTITEDDVLLIETDDGTCYLDVDYK